MFENIFIMPILAAIIAIGIYSFFIFFLIKKPVSENVDKYYCYCDRCENRYQVALSGDSCSECSSGVMHPQDIDPW